jgi:hypothetical protein
MRENRPYGSEGGEGNLPDPYSIDLNASLIRHVDGWVPAFAGMTVESVMKESSTIPAE